MIGSGFNKLGNPILLLFLHVDVFETLAYCPAHRILDMKLQRRPIVSNKTCIGAHTKPALCFIIYNQKDASHVFDFWNDFLDELHYNEKDIL